MAAIITNAFGGERPITQPRLLNDNEAQVAKNVRLVSGRIEPMKGTTTLKALSNALATTIFRYGNNDTETNYWMEWTNHVHAVRSPIANDQYDRLYWTGEGSGSTLYPRYAPNDMVISGNGAYPGGHYRLGLPKPPATISASGTAVSNPTTVTREYVFTYVDHLTTPTKESLPSKSYSVTGVDGGDVVFTNLPDYNEGDTRVTHKRIYRKLSGTYRLITTLTLATQEYTDNMTDATLANQTAMSSTLSNAIAGPTTAPRATAASGAATTETTETRTYFVTVQNGWYLDANGERVDFTESYQSNEVTVTAVYKKQQVTITIPGTSFPSGLNYQRVVLYRKRNTETVDRKINQITIAVAGSQVVFIDSGEDPTTISSYDGASPAYSDQNKRPGAFTAVKDTSYSPTTSTQNRVYCVTYANASGNESPASGDSNVVTVTDGASVTITHTDSLPTGVTVKRLYRKQQNEASSAYRRVGEFPASQTTFPDANTAASIASNASIPAGFQSLLATPKETATVEGKVPAKVVPESRTYVYTYVSAYGEEGPPSEASSVIDIDPSKSVTVSGMSAVPGVVNGVDFTNTNITKKRIYRSSTVGNQAQFQLVTVKWQSGNTTLTGTDVPVAVTQVTDESDQSDLGETLPSETWEPPPAKLFNLRMMANGIACGFVKDGTNRTVVLSEPFLPHAWPPEYSFTTDDSIVGIGVFRQSIAVLTNSFPYIIYGVDPSAMSMTRLELQQACVSAKSIVETGDGVMYASPDGLISISGNGAQNITQNLFTREQWQEFNPSTMQCFFHDGRIHILYGNTQATRGMLIIDVSGQGAVLTKSDINVATEIKGGYYDPRSDTLYWIQGGNIVRQNRGSDLAYTWKSKKFKAPKPLNFNCAQVLAETYPINLKVYADGSLKLSKNVQNANIFTLPSGFLAQDWEYEVTNATITNNVTTVNAGKVYSVSIAQSYAEIKAT